VIVKESIKEVSLFDVLDLDYNSGLLIFSKQVVFDIDLPHRFEVSIALMDFLDMNLYSQHIRGKSTENRRLAEGFLKGGIIS